MAEEALILLVEDREDDVLFIRKAFERAQISTRLEVTRDGQEAIAYLSGEGRFKNRAEYPLPWLILLDLKMPGVDGFEVLKWIRGHACFRSMVVIVLTSSDAVRDLSLAYRLGANSFLIKPSEFESAIKLTKSIHHYWMQHSQLPRLDDAKVEAAEKVEIEVSPPKPLTEESRQLNELGRIIESKKLDEPNRLFPDA